MGETAKRGAFRGGVAGLAARRGFVALVTCSTLPAPVAAAEAREVPMLAVELPEKRGDAVTPVVVGRLEKGMLWLPDGESALAAAPSTSGAPMSGAASAGAASAGAASAGTTSTGAESTPGSTSTAPSVPAAVFELGPTELASCTSSRRFRDAAFLAASLLDDVERVVVAAAPAAAACAARVVDRLQADGHRVERASEAPGGLAGVRVRLELRGAGAPPPPRTAPTTPKPDAPKAPTAAESRLVLRIDDEPVTVQDDGWFAFAADRPVPVTVVLMRGDAVLATLKTMPLLLRLGDNPAYANDRFAGVELARVAVDRPRVSLRVARRAAEDEALALSLSLPFVIKVGFGYTALLPVPDEQARDRPTVEGAVRTHPLLGGAFLVASGTLSLKTDSKVPWAFVGLATLNGDLLHIRNNLSLPVGAGLRVFRSKVEGESEAEVADENVTIPRNVLGPAAHAGLRFRSGLFQVDAALVVAPFKVADSPIITTFDAALTVGYQLSAEDTVVLGSKRHDVRYPTSSGTAKVAAASITLGYERDLY